MSCFDNETPKAIDFSADNSRIFYISESGNFFVYKTSDLHLLFEKEFKMKAIAMNVCKLSRDVIIVFDLKIVVLDSQDLGYKIRYEKRLQRQITGMVVNL